MVPPETQPTLGLANSWPYSVNYTIFTNKSFRPFWHWKVRERIQKPGWYYSFRKITFPGENHHHPCIRSILSSISTTFFLFVFMSFWCLLFYFLTAALSTSALAVLLDASDRTLFQQWLHLSPLSHEHCQPPVSPWCFFCLRVNVCFIILNAFKLYIYIKK